MTSAPVPVQIRRAVADDAPRLTELARAAKAHWGYPREWLRAWRDDLTLTADYVTANRAFVADVAGETLGVCVLEDRGTHWALEHVWVHPAAHGQGIGRVLVARALATARSERVGRVEVLSDPSAEGFYLRLGARRVGLRPAPMPGHPSRTLPVLEFRT